MVPIVKNGTLVYEDQGQRRTAVVGTPSWYTWLETATAFTFAGVEGAFTAHKARAGNRRGGWYWRAYRWQHSQIFRCYLGVTSNLTLSCLHETARYLAVRAENAASGKTAERARQEVQTSPPSHVSTPLPIVSTKCAVPRLPIAHVPRTRLVALLERSATLPLTLVSAPAGSGKTTLLAEWARSTEMPVAWLSLEVADSDPVRFLSYVLMALRALDDRIGRGEASNMLGADPTPDVERCLSELSNDLDSFLTADVALVLDDYQMLESEAVDASFLFLLEHLPQRLHLVVGTRIDPPLPLARLHARGQVNEIRADALRFVALEMQFFLHQMDVDLGEEALLNLEERTEGWIAGVQLAALALRGRGDQEVFLREFRGTHRFLVEYIGEEILARLTPRVRTFLLQTSILEHLSGSLCDAVTAETGSQTMLEELRKANLFVSALDDTGAWYRYHSLFAEGLRHHLLQHDPKHFQQVCVRASAWYEAHEMLFEACEYALQASDVSRAVPLMERQVGKLMGNAQFSVLQRWLSQLPADLIPASPLLSVASTLVHFVDDNQSERLKQTSAAFQQRFQVQTEEADHTKWVEARAHLAFMLFLQALDENDAAQALAIARQTFQDIPEDATYLRNLASLCLGLAEGMTYRLRGDFAAAERVWIETTRQVRATDYHYLNLVVWGSLAEMYEARGELRKSGRLSQRYLQLFQSRRDLPSAMVAGIRLSYATLLVEWNRLDEAEVALRQALLEGESIPVKEFMVDGHFLQVRLAQARGQYEEALAWLQEIEKELVDMPLSHPMLGLAAAARARLLLAQGRVDEAALGFSQRGLHYDDPFSDDPFKEPLAAAEMRFAEYMGLARILIAQGRTSSRAAHLTQALTMLDRLRALYEQAGLTRRVIEILMLTSLALQAQGKTQSGLTQLAEAVTMAEPGGFVRLFADEDEPMAHLLVRLLNHKPAPATYLRTLLEAVTPTQAPRRRDDTRQFLSVGLPVLVESLTQREMEVLSLVGTGASNQDIAAHLVITTNTAKRHVKHILAKLAVTNRIQAVTRARELRLL